MSRQAWLGAFVGSLALVAVGTLHWSLRAQSVQLEALGQEVRRERAALVRLEANAATGCGTPQPVVTVAAPRVSAERDAGGLEAVVAAAVNKALAEREINEKLQREALAQPSPAAEAAALEAETLIEEAIKLRVWNDAISSQFRELTRSMTKDQIRAFHRRLAVAVNEGKLAFEGDMPPF